VLSFRNLILSSILLAAPLVITGCGKKGPLIPPEALAPAPVSDLAVAQKGAKFEVSWTAPSKQEGGAPLRDLAGFLLFRRIVLPAAQDCEECPTAYDHPARLDLDYLQGVVTRIGNRFILADRDIQNGQTYQYKLRSYTEDGIESKDSNKSRRIDVLPPAPPVVEALSSANGVVVAFVAPPPPEGSLVGYNIYRAKSGTPIPLIPLNSAPIMAKAFEDKEILPGVKYSYAVTTVANVKGEVVESTPSKVVEGAMTERE
jgi:predicted small lipoprotein YifL